MKSSDSFGYGGEEGTVGPFIKLTANGDKDNLNMSADYLLPPPLLQKPDFSETLISSSARTWEALLMIWRPSPAICSETPPGRCSTSCLSIPGYCPSIFLHLPLLVLYLVAGRFWRSLLIERWACNILICVSSLWWGGLHITW